MFFRSLCLLSLFACSPGFQPSLNADNGPALTEDSVTDVDQSPVKRQAIGNCWIYATTSWAESQHLTAAGETLNMSESYWTYWHWFDQITRSGRDQIQTGGYFTVAAELGRKYGWMHEGDFIPEEANEERSARQTSALAAITTALQSGDLREQSARFDRARVMRALNAAWQLDEDVVQELVTAFGDDATRTLRNGQATLDGTRIYGTDQLFAFELQPTATQGEPVRTVITLRQALDRWREVSYPGPQSPDGRRAVQRRMQRAMHDRAPVIFTWFVDFAAADGQGRFLAPPEKPGRQGGHMVVLEDYEITNVPGFGTLPAGTLETREEALSAALDPRAELVFLRVKNSWGNWQPRDPNWAGYHDLYMTYLDAELDQCVLDDKGVAIPDRCWKDQGFTSVLLPRYY